MASCSRTACTSGKPGIWRPRLYFWTKSRRLTSGTLNLAFCDHCRDVVTVTDLVTDDAWTALMAYWPTDLGQPEQALTHLDFDILDEQE